jgi:enediyne polyketide synthase
MTAAADVQPPSDANDTPMPPIAVVGMSAWYPGAKDLGEFWGNVVARRRAFRRFPESRLGADYRSPDPLAPDRTYVERGAFVDGFDFDWVGHRIPKRMFDAADLAHWFAFELALRALADGGYDRERLPREGTGVIVGNTLTGEVSRAKGLRLRWPFVARAVREGSGALGYSRAATDQLIAVAEDVYKSVFPEVTEDTLPGMLSNTIAGQVCNLLDLKGGAYTVDGACASSLLAIGQACDALGDGQLDLALAGGVDISMDPFELVGFAKIGALAKDDMYVYERRSQGFYPGEGCGWVLLKRLEDAERDGDYIYATLRGWGMSSDGRGGLTAPGVDGQSIALRRAYERAGYGLSDVDFVEGHGTGTAVGDRTELTALGRMLESEGAEASVGVTALKPMIGHCKAAAGVGSFIKAALAVNQRVLPPLAGCERRHEVFDETSLYPLADGETRPADTRMRAGVSAFGFGGINVHMTVESAAPPKPELRLDTDARALFVSDQDSELFSFRAGTAEDLRAQVEPLAEIAGRLSHAELADLAAHQSRTLGDGPVRAAVVATDPDDLERKFRMLVHMLDVPPEVGEVRVDAAQEVWLANGREACRVGFLFPGQGSQRLGMSRLPVERHDWARELVDAADVSAGELDGRALSTYVFRELHKGDAEQIESWRRDLVRTEVCQPAVCLSSVLQATYLVRLGLRPDVVAGHSLGELTAFWAAGALTADELFALARVRGEAMAQPEGAAGAMAGLRCSPAEAEALCGKVDGYVVVANLNSDAQTVVSGDVEAVEAVVAMAADNGIGGRRLPVANAFHSRYVAPAAERVAGFDGVGETVPPLSARLLSCMDGAEVSEGAPLRAHLARQITERVDFSGLAARMADQVDLLVEVGPGQVLSRLVADNAEARHRVCLPVEAEPGRTRSLHRALSAFFVHGGDLDVAALFEARLTRPFSSPADRLFIENPCEQPFAVPEIPDNFDQAPKGAFEALLPERTGFDGATLEDYLERRGGFLADVIRADLGAAPLDAAAPALPSGNGHVGEARQAVTAAVPEASGDEAQPGRDQDGEGGGAGDRPDPEDILIDLVVERTGFPRDSIRPDMELLNDLNLESIAATEILAKAFELAGAGEPADRSGLFEASIADIAKTIRATAGAGQPADAAVGPADDTGLLDVLESLTGGSTWVRDFEVRFTEEPTVGRAAVGTLASRSVVVAGEPERAEQVAAIAGAFGAAGCGQTETLAYDDLRERAGAPADVLVAVLPAGDDGDTRPGRDTRRFVECLLASLAAVGPEGTVVFVQFGGGYFGSRPERDGGLFSAGAFAATLHHERPGLRVRVVDVCVDDAVDVVAARVVDETATDDVFARAGYDREGARRVPRPFLVAPGGRPRSVSLGVDDVVFVPGGGKGITAELALAVGQETGASVVLAGRSEPGADEALAATLARFEAAAVPCRYVRCDVTDAASVEEAVGRVRADVGPVTCVLYGAGTNRFARVGTETADEALSVVDVKVTGLRQVLAALEDQPPRMVIALSSIIGVTGMPGNAWYALANEALDRMLPRYRHDHPGTEVLSLAYSLWEDTGMAALDGVTEGLRRMGTSALPVGEATSHFLDLLRNDGGAEHVVVTGRIGGLDTWCPDRASVPGHRFLENVVTVQPGVELVARVHLSLERDAYLHDHVYKGTYLFPMVFGLEAMAQAVAATVGRSHLPYVRIEDIELPHPITVDAVDGEEVLVHVEVGPPSADGGDVRVTAGIACRRTGFRMDHFSATFVLPDEPLPEQHHMFDRPEQRLPLDPVRDLYGRFLFHGPAFQRIRDFFVLRSDYAVFTAEHQDPGELQEFVLGDPYFRDALMQAGQVVISQDRALPRRIGAIELHQPSGPPAEQPLIEGALNTKTDEFVDCSIVVTDPDHRVIQRLDHCEFQILEHLATEPTAEEIVDPDARDQRLLDALAAQAAALGLRLPALAVANLPGESPDSDEWRACEETLSRRATDAWSSARSRSTTEAADV